MQVRQEAPGCRCRSTVGRELGKFEIAVRLCVPAPVSGHGVTGASHNGIVQIRVRLPVTPPILAVVM